jgi:hypothetical protein
MKLTLPTLRIAAGLGLAAAMMMGCQDLLNPAKTGSDSGADATDGTGALSLSIKNDSSCLGEWRAILDARTAGHPDSASEAAFLASCVTEVKPGKDKPAPSVPPALLPDSGTRCKWIETQIEGGRDSLTLSFRKYCPDDCHKLEATDSASHEKLCREPKPHPGGLPPKRDGDSASHEGKGDDSLPPKPHGDDSLPPRPHGDDSLPSWHHGDDTLPPKPKAGDDTCKMLHERLETVKPGEPGRADLERLFIARCHEPVPHDSLPLPPPPKDTGAVKPPVNCDELRHRLAGMLDTTSADFARLAETLEDHCPARPPVPDSALPPPPMPPAPDSVCLVLKARLEATAPGTAGRAELEAAFKAKCLEPVPVLPPPMPTCDELRQKLATLDPASADYARLAGALKEHCPDAPVK